MQDRQKMDVDTNLVDRGWQQMSQQLDEVMPVRKRRFFPWFIFLLFIAAGSSAAIYQVFYSGQTAGKQLEAVPPSIHEVVPPKQNKPVADATTIKKINDQEVLAAVSPKTQNKPLTENGLSSELLEPISSADRLHVDAVQYQNADQSVKIDQKIIKKDEEIIDNQAFVEKFNEQKIEERPRDIKQVALLDNKTIDLLENKSNQFAEEIDFIPTKKLNFYVVGENELTLGHNPQGLAAGVGVEYALGRKVSLDVSINYQTLSTSNSVFGVFGLSQVREDTSFDSTTSVYGTPNYLVSEVYDRLKIQKVNLPVQVRFALGNRLQLGTGIQAAYYSRAIVKFDGAGDEDEISVSPEPNGSFANQDLYDPNRVFEVYSVNQITNAANLPYDLNPKRWQWSALLSAQYKISPRFRFEAKFKANITQWPDSRESYGARSSLAFGLKYLIR